MRIACAALAAVALIAAGAGVSAPATADGLAPADGVGVGLERVDEGPGPGGKPARAAEDAGLAPAGGTAGGATERPDGPTTGRAAGTAALAADIASPVSSDPLPTVQIDGVVWAQAVVGDTVYVGGNFTKARPAGAAPGTQEVARRNLLAYNLHTGELIQSWAPSANGEVRDLAVSPDGTRLYAVGQFTAIGSTTRYRAASFSTSTGALTSFRPGINATVHAVAVRGSTVYLGGIFSTVNGLSRPRVAAVDTSAGTTTRTFRASVGNRSVQDLVLSPDGSQLVIGGNFTSVNGSSSPGYGLARLATSSGAMLPLPVNQEIRNAGDDSAILSLASDGEYFYGVGYHWSMRGNLEGSFAARWTDGTLVWIEDCHGDSYSIAPFGGAVYSASHKHDCTTSGGHPETRPRVFKRATATTRTVEGVNLADDTYGYPDHPGTPRPDLLNWYPDFAIGTFTGQEQGPWDVVATDGYVLYGGEFPTVNGKRQQGLVRFAVRDNAPNDDGPRPGAQGFALTATSPTGGVVNLSWPAVYDRDDETVTYSVYRGTTSSPPLTVQQRSARFWETGTLTFADLTAPAGTTQRYIVAARDPWGNAAWTSWVDVYVAAGALRAYPETILRDRPAHYWRMGGGQGPVVAFAGASRLTTGDGMIFGREGAVAGDPNTAVRTVRDATSTAWTMGAAGWGPRQFSVEVWIRTGAPGGRIVGFGSTASSSDSARADRHLYLDDAGRVVFGVEEEGARRTVTSPGAVTDGRWHHLVGTLGPGGMSLWVDGARVAFRTSVTSAGEYGGYWRVGGDRIRGWSPASSTSYFRGTLDEVAVYPYALGTLEIREHRDVGRTGSAA